VGGKKGKGGHQLSSKSVVAVEDGEWESRRKGKGSNGEVRRIRGAGNHGTESKNNKKCKTIRRNQKKNKQKKKNEPGEWSPKVTKKTECNHGIKSGVTKEGKEGGSHTSKVEGRSTAPESPRAPGGKKKSVRD